MIALVLVEYSVKSLDKTFSYNVPERINNIKVGMKVLVPFGKQIINGFIMSLEEGYNQDYKEIIRIVDSNLILNSELMELGKYLSEVTMCSKITAFQTMLPSGLKIKEQLHNYQLYDEYVVINKEKNIDRFINDNPRKAKQISILELLIDHEPILKSEIKGNPLNELIRSGYVLIQRQEKTRINPTSNNINKYELTKEQNDAIEKINLNKDSVYLIHGVTGSGKTLVYLHLINKVIETNKTAILLVPEISLTTQTVKQFYDWFGSDVAIFHSALSDGEKYDEYLKILNNKVHVVIGTRSAIFVPLTNIGIIIMDEEHSENYKQENNPRYHAIDMAKYRANYYHCPLVLGSATPSLESMARAKKNVYNLITLDKRVNDYPLPNINIVDMTPEMKNGNTIFSQELILKINNRLSKKEQVLLLLNRRGYSTIVTCQNCGYTYKCPNCEIALTYHKTSNNLRCHYCGYFKAKDDLCEHCHEDGLKDYGLGTEKLELELNHLFPFANIVRMDTDTTSRKGMHSKIINDFSAGKYDILLGTQMISKGLDFKKVSLVGIINADSTLNIPDYKSEERTYQLLEQVSGRAGRSGLPSEVIIQTFNPDNYAFKCVKEHSYNDFYNYEMNIRKTLLYPPYTFLTLIRIVSKNYEEASKESSQVKRYLENKLVNMKILGPTTANMFKINNIYHFQIIIKYRSINNLKEVLKELDNIYSTKKDISLEIDNCNPNV